MMFLNQVLSQLCQHCDRPTAAASHRYVSLHKLRHQNPSAVQLLFIRLHLHRLTCSVALQLFETAPVFFTKPEKRFLYVPSPALAIGRARAEKWAHAESDGQSYLEVQRFNGKPALAALSRSAACAAAFGVRAANYYHLSPHIRAQVLCAPPRTRYVFLKVAGAQVYRERKLPPPSDHGISGHKVAGQAPRYHCFHH
jgi:hypothetical protein